MSKSSRSSSKGAAAADHRHNIKDRGFTKQSREMPKRNDRERRRSSYASSRTVERNRPTLQMSPNRRVTRASVAWNDDRAPEVNRLRHIKIRSSREIERNNISVVLPQVKEHRPNAHAGTHTKSGYRKSSSGNTKGKHPKLKDSEVSLSRKLIDAESKCIKFERKLRAKNLALSKRMESQKSLEQLLSKASSEKVSFRDKWMDLKRVKASLKDQVEKQAREIKSLKRKLANSEERAKKVITDKALSLKQAEKHPSASAHSTTDVDGNLFQDMLENFKNLLESHLQCSICSEVYVFSVTITCGHTFCLECIEEWKHKKRNCPICRASITSQHHTKVVDDYIDKFVDGFAPDTFKTARKELLEEHKRKGDLRKQRKRERRNRRERHDRLNRDFSSDAEMNFDDVRPFLDLEWSLEEAVIPRNEIQNFLSPTNQRLSISPIRLSLRSSSSNSVSSSQRNRLESDSSESDTTWNPPVSDQVDRLSEVSVRSDISNQSRNPSIDISESIGSGFRPSPSRSRTRSRSTNRSLSRSTSASRSSRFLSRYV